MASEPVVNAGLKYVNGLDLTRTGNKTITVAAGAARDSTNTNDLVLSATTTNTGTTVGVNGVDIAAIVLNSFYAVYLIGDSFNNNPTGTLLSLDATTPSLPFGYNIYRRIGWILTDGSANILQFWQYGTGQTRRYYYDVGISELSGGSSASYAAIDLATSVPPIATTVLFDATYTPNGATDVAEFLPFGSTATNGVVRLGTGVAGAQVVDIEVPCELDSGVPKIQYKVTAGDTLTLLTIGYDDQLT